MFRTGTYPSRLDNHEEDGEQYKRLVLGYQLGLDAAARAGMEEDGEQYKRLVLGYQLGLDAAARAGMSSSISDRQKPMAGASNSTGSDTRSEFRLSYSEIIDAYQMERKR
jgi:2-keto-4-pentenoate hydratase/2-oxohepta-3-ene-1,7-dioic acid hydratase in catechol pathway